LTVKRSEVGLLDEADGGPRETVAVEIFCAAVARRGRDSLLESVLSATVIAIDSLARVAAERWLRRVDMLMLNI
jgi:predicted nuclease with RNAse H fold